MNKSYFYTLSVVVNVLNNFNLVNNLTLVKWKNRNDSSIAVRDGTIGQSSILKDVFSYTFHSKEDQPLTFVTSNVHWIQGLGRVCASLESKELVNSQIISLPRLGCTLLAGYPTPWDTPQIPYSLEHGTRDTVPLEYMVPGTRKGPGTRDTLPLPPLPVDRMKKSNRRLRKHCLPRTTIIPDIILTPLSQNNMK